MANNDYRQPPPGDEDIGYLLEQVRAAKVGAAEEFLAAYGRYVVKVVKHQMGASCTRRSGPVTLSRTCGCPSFGGLTTSRLSLVKPSSWSS